MKIKNYLKEMNDEVLVDKYVNSFSRFFYFIVFTVASPIIDFVRFIFELNEIYLSYSMKFLIIEDAVVKKILLKNLEVKVNTSGITLW